MDDSDPPQPVPKPADAKAKQVRERAMDLLANAAIHAQRLDEAARRIGLTPDLVDGLGDHLYEAAVSQLDVASKILERSQMLVDRLFDLSRSRSHSEQHRFLRIDAKIGQTAHIDLIVRNSAEQPATVTVKIIWTPPPTTPEPTWCIGQPKLPGRRQTAVEIDFPATLAVGVYPVFVTSTLQYSGEQIELPPHEYEIWVRT